MKTRHMILGYLGLVGLVTLLITLNSIQGLLPAIAVKVLIALLILTGLGLLYLLYWLYSHFHKTYHAIQSRSLELKAHDQQLKIEQERWTIERAALLLNQQHQASRIYPDSKGYMPMLVNVTEAGYQYINLPHPAHMGRIGSQGQQAALPEHAESRAGLPTEIRYEQIAAQIPRGHGLLGVSANGAETSEFADFMTMLISGGSNSGKSNTVGLKLHEAIQNGRDIRLIVIDWHWRKPDSLYNKIRGYESRFLMPVITTEEDTLPALEWYYNEYKRRLADGVTRHDQDILLVCDEVPDMMDCENENIPKMLKKVARMAGRAGRGFGIYAWFIAQQMVGMAWLRNVVHTCICHKANRINEAEIACNDHKDIARDMENWPKGRVIVYGQNLTGVQVLQMPIFTPPTVDAGRGSGAVYVEEDGGEMEALQPLSTSAKTNLPSSAREGFGRRREDNQEASGRSFTENDLLNPVTLKKFLNEAGKMRAEGMSIDAILKAYDLPAGGRNNQNLKALLDGQDQAANE